MPKRKNNKSRKKAKKPKVDESLPQPSEDEIPRCLFLDDTLQWIEGKLALVTKIPELPIPENAEI